jgi:hypothetical protein
VVIEDIPLICCGSCGESYFTAETMHEIERVRTHRKSFGIAQTVTVAQLPITTDEIHRRLADLKSGKVKGIPGDEVLARIKAKYTK